MQSSSIVFRHNLTSLQELQEYGELASNTGMNIYTSLKHHIWTALSWPLKHTPMKLLLNFCYTISCPEVAKQDYI